MLFQYNYEMEMFKHILRKIIENSKLSGCDMLCVFKRDTQLEGGTIFKIRSSIRSSLLKNVQKKSFISSLLNMTKV